MVAMAARFLDTVAWAYLAAHASDNPRRGLAYSSLVLAGYSLAAGAAIGSGLAGPESKALLVTAVLFHLSVLVVFKLGAFLVLSSLETEGGSHRMQGLKGLARREPILAGSMFGFMPPQAGVPPFS